MKKLCMMLLVTALVLGLAACGSNDSNAGGNDDKPVVPETETVEITLDNWQDYFEIVEGTYVSTNEFDEPVRIYPEIKFVLKDGIVLGTDEWGNVFDYEIAIEYSYTSAYYNVEMDLENCTLTIGDLAEGETPEQETSMNNFYREMNNFYVGYNSRLQDDIVVEMEIMSDVEITRIQGSITIQK